MKIGDKVRSLFGDVSVIGTIIPNPPDIGLIEGDLHYVRWSHTSCNFDYASNLTLVMPEESEDLAFADI